MYYSGSKFIGRDNIYVWMPSNVDKKSTTMGSVDQMIRSVKWTHWEGDLGNKQYNNERCF